METKKKIVFLICLGIFISITIFILCNITEKYSYSDSYLILYEPDKIKLNTLTNVSYARSESCVHKNYRQSNVKKYENGFEIKLNNDDGKLRSGRVQSVSQYKGDMMFIIDIDNMSKSDIAFYAIWLWNKDVGEIDLMETANKDTNEYATTLIRYKDGPITTQCPQNNWSLVPFKKEKYGPHKLVFIQQGSVVTVFMDPYQIQYSDDRDIPKIFHKDLDSMKQYDLNKKYYANNLYNGKNIGKQSFSDLKNTPWYLIFNLEARHFDENYEVSSCKSKVYSKNHEASFKIKKVKYYDLTGKSNPAIPLDNPKRECANPGEDIYNNEKFKNTPVHCCNNNKPVPNRKVERESSAKHQAASCDG